jgi:hypothetical protein
MLTAAWKPHRPHLIQYSLWHTKARFAAVAAGRGSGKTELARRRIVRYLPVSKPWPDPYYFYALPTVNQARRVAWKQILALIPREWIKGEPNKSELRIETVFGSTLYIVGMDKPARIEGLQWDGGIIDESCDQRPQSFDLSVLPALSHRNGWCWRIGVPKRTGVGAADFKKFYERGLAGEGGIESFTWPSNDILTDQQLHDAKEYLDQVDYDEQYGANWQNASGLIFHAFSDENKLTGIAYDPTRPILVCSDFNVNPMCWALAQQCGDQVHFFGELFLRNCTTQKALDELWSRYGGRHKSEWWFFGDATGKARDTTASDSDYKQILNDSRFAQKRVYYPKVNPARKDRYASCNAMFCNANQVRRAFLDKDKCQRLLADVEGRAYKSGTFDPNDVGDMGHMSDAAGYMLHKLFPVRIAGTNKPRTVLIT